MMVFAAVAVLAVVVLGLGFFIFKTMASSLSQFSEKMAQEASQARNALEDVMSRNRTETRASMHMVVEDIQNRMTGFQTSTEARLEIMRGELDKKLSETITKNFQSFEAVSKRLEELQAVTGQVVNLSQGVKDLSRILESPKLRGSMGEFQLGEMLRQVLPGDVYEEQFALDSRSKEAVDAVIKLKEGLLCIDSKFPLNNARLLLEGQGTDEDFKIFRKAFAQDVKVMVDSISIKYILPDRTLDFALMFIPAESIFYELMKDGDLHQYCLKKHVIPVSPNSFYAYLQAIAVGFRGLKIQAEAKKIEATIMRLKNDFMKFQGDFNKVGKHLKDAQTQYNNVEDRVERFGVIIDKLGLEGSALDETKTPSNLNESVNMGTQGTLPGATI